MILTSIILSLQITAIYFIFQQGMLLGWFRIMMANHIDLVYGKKASRYIQKPLWDCLICMSSVWTIILTLTFDIKLMLLVCGINVFIDQILNHEGEVIG